MPELQQTPTDPTKKDSVYTCGFAVTEVTVTLEASLSLRTMRKDTRVLEEGKGRGTGKRGAEVCRSITTERVVWFHCQTLWWAVPCTKTFGNMWQ